MASNTSHGSILLYALTKQEWARKYEEALQQGIYRPFMYPWDSLPVLWLLLAMLILPRLPQHIANYARVPVIGLIFGHCIYVGRSCRTLGLAGGFMIGLAACWGCIMTLAFLVFNDLKKDFVRLEAVPYNADSKREHQANGSATSASTEEDYAETGLRRRKDITSPTTTSGHSNIKTSSFTLSWQRYPSSFSHCLDWSLDLMTAFRGVNWNFRNPTIPALPNDITSHSHSPSNQSLQQLQRSALVAFLRGYIEVDILKSLAIQDPYFLGLAPLTSPSPYPLLHPHPLLTKLLRLLLAVISTRTILSFIFTLCPLLFPIPLQSLTSTPLHLPEMYPPFIHPLFPTIPRSGLAGFWGTFWHQLFRFGISQPGTFIANHLSVNNNSNLARAIQLLSAFTLSGLIHASASYTMFPPAANVARPLTGPLAFFVLQAVGILLQMFPTKSVVRPLGLPAGVRRIGNAVYVAAWLWVTGPLLADDFARSGVWLFEPVPVSFVRGFGGLGWWMWGGRWVGWRWEGEERWWLRGLVVY